MDNTLRYESNNGAVIRFAPDSRYHYTGTTLRDYKHGYKQLNGKINGFTKGITDYKLNVVVSGGTEADRDAMLEAFEYDVAVGKAGKLWANGYYLQCFVTASKKDVWWSVGGYMRAELTITTDNPVWVKETNWLFTAGETGGTGIDYAHDWSFDYVSNIMVQEVENRSYIPQPFRMVIYGELQEDVSIVVGGNVYGLAARLGSNEYITIDSLNKTITKTDAYGNTQSLFSSRVGDQREGSGTYIFEPIAVGVSPITWSSNYSFLMTLIEQRAEPRWA